MARQICNLCKNVTKSCDECQKTFKPGEEIFCDGDKWDHVCRECRTGKIPNAKIEILD